MSVHLNSFVDGMSQAAYSSIRHISPLEAYGKIFGGLAISLAGGLLANYSGSIAARCSKNAASPVRKITKSALAILGIAISVYGAIKIGSACREGLPFSCQARLENARDRMLTCPEALKRWEEVGNFSLQCGNDFIGGVGSVEEREIVIQDEICYTGHFLNDAMHGMLRAPDYIALHSAKCQMSAEDYAHKHEELQYNISLKAFELEKQCGAVWPKSWQAFHFLFEPGGVWHSFSTFLDDMKESGHFKLYLDQWRDLCKNSDVVV